MRINVRSSPPVLQLLAWSFGSQWIKCQLPVTGQKAEAVSWNWYTYCTVCPVYSRHIVQCSVSATGRHTELLHMFLFISALTYSLCNTVLQRGLSITVAQRRFRADRRKGDMSSSQKGTTRNRFLGERDQWPETRARADPCRSTWVIIISMEICRLFFYALIQDSLWCWILKCTIQKSICLKG